MNVRDLPWRLIRRVGFSLRKELASKDKPNRDHILVDMSVEDLRDFFREKHYREGWFLSYNYHGEDGNLCRAELEHDDYGDYQHHIRLFDAGAGKTEVYAHYELDPIQFPRKHLNGVGQSVKKGQQLLKTILDSHKIAYVEKKGGS